MTDPFILKLALSFAIGGLWITFASVAAERLGTKVGGVIGGLPSTALVAYGFIAWTQGPQQAFDATTAFPLAFAGNALYLVAFAALAQRGLAAAVGGGVAVWLATQGLLLILPPPSIWLSVAVWLVVLVIAYWLLQHVLGVRAEERVRIGYTPWQMASRALFAGGMVALAVVMSKVGGPLWGSIFAAFPALYTSTLILISRSVGIHFARALTTPLMISSIVNVTLFVLALRAVILTTPLLAALAIAYAVSMVSAYGTYRFIQAKLS